MRNVHTTIWTRFIQRGRYWKFRATVFTRHLVIPLGKQSSQRYST